MISSRGRSGRPVGWLRLLRTTPVLLVLACAVLFSIPTLRAFDRWFIHENGPVEMSTFLSFLAAGFFATRALWPARARGASGLVLLMVAGFAACSFVAALEEISWGQSLAHFASPPGWERFNVQDETNLHNLDGVQNLHSFLLFAIGAVGLALSVLSRRAGGLLRAPHVVSVCFAIVAVLGGLDWWTDNFPFGDPADTVIGMLTEVNEMVLSLGLMAYAFDLRTRVRPLRGRRTVPEPRLARSMPAGGSIDAGI